MIDVAFFGPTGSGKSSLIGSLHRASNKRDEFPDRVKRTLRHPGPDAHGTENWLETPGNELGTIVYQDTRGDTVCNYICKPLHKLIWLIIWLQK